MRKKVLFLQSHTKVCSVCRGGYPLVTNSLAQHPPSSYATETFAIVCGRCQSPWPGVAEIREVDQDGNYYVAQRDGNGDN